MSQFWYLVFVFFDDVKPPIDFWLTEDTPLVVLKSKLDNLLQYTNKRKTFKIEYHLPSIDNEGKTKFNNFELKTYEDLKVMWKTYHRYKKKCLIEVDMTIVRFIGDIVKILKYPESSNID